MIITDAVRDLARDLASVFGARLRSLVVYRPTGASAEEGTPTLVVVDGPTADDLRACAGRVPTWHDAGLATPLLLGEREFARSLDAFPVEFGAILAHHIVVSGPDPFEGLAVDTTHLRHACEIQARSHLLHLREGYLETHGRGDLIADLIVRSAKPLAALVTSVARLQGGGEEAVEAARAAERAIGSPPDSLAPVAALTTSDRLTSDDARRMFPRYLEAVERLTQYIDQWDPRNRLLGRPQDAHA
jgi:hypothetical protein